MPPVGRVVRFQTSLGKTPAITGCKEEEIVGIAQVIFYLGAAMMACAAAGSIITLVVLHITGKRLNKQMEEEYGPPDHR